VKDAFDGRCQTGPVVGVTALADSLGHCWVRVYHISQLAESHPALHCHGDLADHIAGVASDNGCAQYLIGALFNVKDPLSAGF